MSSVVLEQPTIQSQEGLPNKFTYPEFAGYAGENLLHEIVEAMLPFSLRRTWEIFERKHAYDNDCYLSLTTVAEKARKHQRTIDRNIATLMSRGLLVLRPGHKFFRNSDGSMRKKAVMLKDFSGLYALAHEYYLWQQSQDHVKPTWENVAYIKENPRLVAKLCRFEDYRRLLDQSRLEKFTRVQPDPRFSYREDEDIDTALIEDAEDAEVQSSGPNTTTMTTRLTTTVTTVLSKERINENAYTNSLCGDSFDSDEDQEMRREAGATSNVCSQNRAPVAGDYTKARGEQNLQNESETNLVPPSQKNVPPGAGKTRESAENHPDVQRARGAMEASGIEPGGAHRRADELPLPPKHPLARSFAHEIASPFGDLNEKGSKTGIERSIETFELNQPAAVLLCLVRAYVIARDTKAEKIRYHHPETGAPNRMPLFCSMFKKFARALAFGSPWEYTWQKMMEDIEADDRLGVWLGEHQAELAATPESHEAEQEAAELPGWADGADAYGLGERLMQAIVDAGYSDVAVALREIDERYYVVYKVLIGDGGEIVLSSEAEIAYLIEQAELGQL